ncbi:hypothetical protein HYH03_018960 [Edaphochlamys debaryana]|uniref:phytol kinase n=1 Tax=Edaphochlamys debaryana TaxID=47281 RepID=A0A835XEZ9_9CHLO|nr:hypothetical protein HYH03_018960 [Edaphochlamys debaryana]|eukprot:KAG2482085.1 hypothetical protein HYH03_018960 [Edaphochlamys debaryana]
MGESLRQLVKGMPPLAAGQRGGQIAGALAGWPEFQSALLRTLAVASRIRLEGSGTGAEARREAGVGMLAACLRVCQRLVFLGAVVPKPSTSPEPTRPNLAVLDFARRLLCADTLQALAARLAEVRQAVSGGDAGQLKPTVFASYCQLTHAVASLLGACLTWAIVTSVAAGEAAAGVPSAAATAAAEAEKQAAAVECYRSELAAALRSSCIAEHIAATTLVLLRTYTESRDLPLFRELGGPRDQLLQEVSTCTHAMLPLAAKPAASATAALGPSSCASASAAPSLSASSPGQQHSSPLAALRRAVALDPCASYLTLAYGMFVLSCMDGGGTRGLPEDEAIALCWPLCSEARARLQQLARAAGQGSAARAARAGFPPSAAATAAPSQQQHPPPSTATPLAATLASTPSRRLQLGWHTALGLTMRAARMCVRAAEEAAAGRTREQEVAALTAALEGRGTLRVLLGEELAAAVAGEALAVTAQLRALLPAASEADATAGAHADPTSDAGSCGPGQVDQGAEWWRLMTRLAPHLGTTLVMDLFPAQSFGDCLRMHLPRMPGSAEPLPPIPPPALASALAGGVLPCLERLVRRAATAAPGDTGTGQALAGFDSVSPGLNALLVDFTSNLCTVAPTWLDAAAARLERGGALTPPERQLAGLLGAAAVAWLPELSRRIWSGPFMTQAGSVDCVMPLGCVSAGLRWLPLLSCAAAPAARDAAAAAASSGPEAPATNVAATSSGGGGAGGGWRSFAEALFPRQAFISLAVDIQQRANSDDGSRQALAPWTAEAACTFAALRPKEAAAGVGTVLRTEQVRALATELRAGGQAEAADAAEALAAQLVRWERGGGARSGGRSGGRGGGRAGAAASGPPLAARYGVWVPLLQSAAALLPASPAAARQLLGGCSNPACADLEGDSDAALPLRACAGCGGAASYCSRECQMAHWRSGHREACGGGAGGGGRGGG